MGQWWAQAEEAPIQGNTLPWAYRILHLLTKSFAKQQRQVITYVFSQPAF